MEIYLAEQTLFFLQALLVGAALGLLYDAFRITRIAVPAASWVIFVEDVLFFLFCAVTTFFFLLRSIDGQVRFFLLIGEGLGAVVYHFTLSILIMRVSRTIIGVIKAIFGFIFRILIRPVWRLLVWIVTLLLRPVRFFGRKAKKSGQRLQYGLKKRRIVLYNHFKGKLIERRSSSKRKKKKHGASQTQTEEFDL